MITQLLESRHLPSLLGEDISVPSQWAKRRQALMDLLSEQEYGSTPAAPKQVCGSILSAKRDFGGKANWEQLKIGFDTQHGAFSFPINLILPRSGSPAPIFVALSFSADVPNQYLPIEEIIDHGYGVANIYYQDIATDDDRETGLAALYPHNQPNSWGKIGMWAFAASRVMDYLLTREDVDHKRIAVIGHSRLGKTALWAGAQDERFSLVISNDSGCAGAAIARGNAGETVKAITECFGYWFCPNYAAWASRECDMPFDQHMLLALIAPRHLCVASAAGDAWADPKSEFLSCVAATRVYGLLGIPGLVTPDRLPETDEAFQEGYIGYHMRSGGHFLSRTDWLRFIEYRDRHCI